MYGAPDTERVFIAYGCPSMQYDGPPETMLAMTCDQRYSAQIWTV